MSFQYFYGFPYKNQFAEFIYYNKYFFQPEVERIMQFWDQEKELQAEVSGNEAYSDESIRKSSVVPLENTQQHHWIYQKLTTAIHESNQHRFHFDLLGFWEPLQLTEYKAGGFFDWHLDFGVGETSNRKLSITVQLSDPDSYEGGDLEFMINGKAIKASREKGSAIVFPSFIMHRVTPVTKGTRNSIVGWVAGPPFR